MQSDARRHDKGSTRPVSRAYQDADSLPLPASASMPARDRTAAYAVILARVPHPLCRHQAQPPHPPSPCSRACASAAHTLPRLHVAALQIDRGRRLAHYPAPSRSRVRARPGPDASRRPDCSARLSTRRSPFSPPVPHPSHASPRRARTRVPSAVSAPQASLRVRARARSCAGVCRWPLVPLTVRAFMRACVRACVRAWVRECLRACRLSRSHSSLPPRRRAPRSAPSPPPGGRSARRCGAAWLHPV